MHVDPAAVLADVLFFDEGIRLAARERCAESLGLAREVFGTPAAAVFAVFNTAALLFPAVGGYTKAYIFVLGLAVSFHLLFTFYVVRDGQDDIKYNGWVFSAATILTVNAVLFGVFVSIPAKGTGPAGFMTDFLGFAAQDFLNIFYRLLKAVQALGR